MIAIGTAPTTATSGSTICILVTGCPQPPTGIGTIGTVSIKGRVTGANGSYMICYQLPRNVEGALVLIVSCGIETDRVAVSVV